MGTVVTIQVAPDGADEAVTRAFEWFHHVETICTRFKPDSELMRLSATCGVAVPVSDILFQSVRFALMVAEESRGAFDPTVGHRMEARGFNREHRTGALVETPVAASADVSYRDVEVDEERLTITLRRPLILDLGAVAKGLAVDAAARELEPFTDFAIDAGGDLFLGGRNPQGNAWTVGIRHPRRDGELIDSFTVTNQAICTSGDYERGQHLLDIRTALDGRTGEPGSAVASASVIAPGAMLADALATAAFVMGPHEGIEFLERMGVGGLIVTNNLEKFETMGLRDGL